MTRRVGIKLDGNNVIQNVIVVDVDSKDSIEVCNRLGYEILNENDSNIVGIGWKKNEDGTFTDIRPQ